MYDAYDIYDRSERDNERNELQTRIDELEAENEQLRESIRIEAEEGSVGWGLASDHQAERDALQAENERLRERVTNAEMALRCIREGWEKTSTGLTRLQIDLMLGNPEATEPTLRNVA